MGMGARGDGMQERSARRPLGLCRNVVAHWYLRAVSPVLNVVRPCRRSPRCRPRENGRKPMKRHLDLFLHPVQPRILSFFFFSPLPSCRGLFSFFLDGHRSDLGRDSRFLPIFSFVSKSRSTFFRITGFRVAKKKVSRWLARRMYIEKESTPFVPSFFFFASRRMGSAASLDGCRAPTRWTTQVQVAFPFASDQRVRRDVRGDSMEKAAGPLGRVFATVERAVYGHDRWRRQSRFFPTRQTLPSPQKTWLGPASFLCYIAARQTRATIAQSMSSRSAHGGDRHATVCVCMRAGADARCRCSPHHRQVNLRRPSVAK